MIDENAFGLLISYFGIENDEYALEREEFVERITAFRREWRARLLELVAPAAPRALDLGHALYLEFGEDELPEQWLTWLRELRAALAELEIESVGVVTFGGRWVHEEGTSRVPGEAPEIPGVLVLGELKVHSLSLPSEPLRHALDADAAARLAEDDEAAVSGWGPGLYVETEAIDALGRKLKNAPTTLQAGDASFYRLSR